MIRPYRDEVVQQIKEAGQELIDKAESIVGDGLTGIIDVVITIQIGSITDCVNPPEINVNTTLVGEKTAKRWNSVGR